MGLAVFGLPDPLLPEEPEWAVPADAQWFESLLLAADATRVEREGEWSTFAYRRAFPLRNYLETRTPGSSLRFTSAAPSLSILLENQMPSVYRSPLLAGILQVRVDGALHATFDTLWEAREIVLFRDLPPTERLVEVHFFPDDFGHLAQRVIGFREMQGRAAKIDFLLSAERPELLSEVRLSLYKEEDLIWSRMDRSWLSGRVRLAGIEPGENYHLKIEAAGWGSLQTPLPHLHAQSERVLSPLFLPLDTRWLTRELMHPHLGHPTAVLPGESFFALPRQAPMPGASVLSPRLIRTVEGVDFTVDLKAALEGDHLEFEVNGEWHPGTYDLEFWMQTDSGISRHFAPHSIILMEKSPERLKLVTAGHLDNWGQTGAEYLEILASVVNLVAPDILLLSNEVHPAVNAAGLRDLQVPYLVTIGNHTFGYEADPSYFDREGNYRSGGPFPLSVSRGAIDQSYYHREPHYSLQEYGSRSFDDWYGNPIGKLTIGRDWAIMNFGYSWKRPENEVAISKAQALWETVPGQALRIMNVYESDAPEEFLRENSIRLMHCAHGWGLLLNHLELEDVAGHWFEHEGVIYVGKRDSHSFRVVQLDRQGKLHQVSYGDHPTDPIPLPRHRIPALRVEKGKNLWNLRIVNEYAMDFPDARHLWVLPAGDYRIEGARVEYRQVSRDGAHVLISLRFDLAARSTLDLSAQPLSSANLSSEHQ